MRWFREVLVCPLVEWPLASRMQVWRILHEEDLYPYHDQRVQHLEPGDHAQRFDLCYWITAHPEMLSVILFTDEASFSRDGINNSRNVHTWSHENPHETRVTNLQRRFSVNVWCGGPPLWSSGQSFWLQIQRSRVRFPALPDFLSSSGSGTGSTQPREVN